MGGCNDFCNSSGIKARKKGMYKKESKTTKCCYLMLFVLSAITYLIIGSLHGNRSSNAGKINSEYDTFMSMPKKPYDGCNIPAFIQDPEVSSNEIFDLATNYEVHCLGKEQDCAERGTEWT